jgi:predicted PurR-regulated permease PerM
MALSKEKNSSNASSKPGSWVEMASYLLAALVCLSILVYGLLPGLIAICVGHLIASSLSGQSYAPKVRLSPTVAALVVIVLPILAIVLLLANARGMVFGAVSQYQAMLHHLAATVLEIRQKLPPAMAEQLPDELIAAQKWLADYLQSRAHALGGYGTASLRGGLLAYVGLIVGALIVGTSSFPVLGSGIQSVTTVAPLREAIRQRGRDFMESFKQIVVAQFWIAGFNALCTAIFLFVALPLAGINMPYAGSLVALTFIAGLIPIVGNLLCNSVMTIAGVSISPTVGLMCLLFLIAIHKFEYFINAKIVGKRTNTAAWELLIVMFVGESIFGVSGLVAAPLYYAYVKKELARAGLI